MQHMMLQRTAIALTTVENLRLYNSKLKDDMITSRLNGRRTTMDTELLKVGDKAFLNTSDDNKLPTYSDYQEEIQLVTIRKKTTDNTFLLYDGTEETVEHKSRLYHVEKDTKHLHRSDKVLALYPGTDTLYRATIGAVSGLDKCDVKFEDDIQSKHSIPAGHIFKLKDITNAGHRQDQYSQYCSEDEEESESDTELE